MNLRKSQRGRFHKFWLTNFPDYVGLRGEREPTFVVGTTSARPLGRRSRAASAFVGSPYARWRLRAGFTTAFAFTTAAGRCRKSAGSGNSSSTSSISYPPTLSVHWNASPRGQIRPASVKAENDFATATIAASLP